MGGALSVAAPAGANRNPDTSPGGRREGNRSHTASERAIMNKQPWALILGASSGFGEATALELARAGMNIFGIHMDRRDKLQRVEELKEKIHHYGRESHFVNV